MRWEWRLSYICKGVDELEKLGGAFEHMSCFLLKRSRVRMPPAINHASYRYLEVRKLLHVVLINQTRCRGLEHGGLRLGIFGTS